MQDIRHAAHAAAQDAWKRALDYHMKHRRWDPVLVAELHAAERWVDDVETAERLMAEWPMDAAFEGFTLALEDLADAEADDNGLPDIPLAAVPYEWTRFEDLAGGAA